MKKNQSEAKEISEVALRYERRKLQNIPGLYSPTTMAVMMARQERERALIYWMHTSGLLPIGDKSLLEIGCGTGGNILEMLRFGFEPHNLVGNELLQDRGLMARLRLPAVTQIHIGDALTMDFVTQFDVVFQSTVFTSILDDEFQQASDYAWLSVITMEKQSCFIWNNIEMARGYFYNCCLKNIN